MQNVEIYVPFKSLYSMGWTRQSAQNRFSSAYAKVLLVEKVDEESGPLAFSIQSASEGRSKSVSSQGQGMSH